MAKQPRSLTGRVVAITGGARGIGRATAEALAREGARVAIGDLDAGLAGRTAEEIGPAASAFALDVTDRGSFEAFVDAVEAELGPVDVLVNNAGIMALGPFVEEDATPPRPLANTRAHGLLQGKRAPLPRSPPRRSGHLVNIASVA